MTAKKKNKGKAPGKPKNPPVKIIKVDFRKITHDNGEIEFTGQISKISYSELLK